MINKYIDNLKTFFKNMHKKDNIDILIGITSILVALWVIIYAIPTLFASIFHTLLGNLILLLLVVFAGVTNLQTGLITLIIIIILYQFSKYSYIKESFNQNNHDKKSKCGWSKKTIKNFMKYQYITFPNAVFNMEIIQKQASEDEANTLLKTGSWPWSQEIQDIYMNVISRNEIVSENPGESLMQAMKLYNENAIKQLLSWNTKEGQFLLRGVDLGPAESEPEYIKEKKHNSIKCVSGKNINDSYMEKTTYLGTDYFSGLFKINKDRILNEDLPKVIPGFGFIKNSCNPCVALNETADYSCPFNINVKDNNNMSKIWADLWGIIK